MPTVDMTKGGNKSLPEIHLGKLFVIPGEINCAEQSLAQDDVAQLIDVPAGTLVLGVRHKTKTAEGGAGTYDIGDGDDPDGFVDGADANDATVDAYTALALTEAAPNTVTGYTAGKFYKDADTIDLIAKAALDKAHIKAWAVCIDMN